MLSQRFNTYSGPLQEYILRFLTAQASLTSRHHDHE